MKNRLPIFALTCAFVLLFQNCSPTSHGSPGNSTFNSRSADSLLSWPEDRQLGGTGNGYDGKIFVYLSPEAPCPDLSYVRTAVQVTGDIDQDPKAFLIREACQNIPARELPAASFTFMAQSQLIYNGEVLVEREELTGKVPLPPPQPVNTAPQSLACALVTNRQAHGFDGEYSLKIETLSEGFSFGELSISDRNGFWVRHSSLLFFKREPMGSDRQYTFYSATNDSRVTVQVGDGRLATVSFYVPAYDVSGFSGRPAVESYSGTDLFTCTGTDL